jgi:hemin uptake protein HemP
VLDSRALFGERLEIAIRHEGQLYRLRKTRHGKLILNK